MKTLKIIFRSCAVVSNINKINQRPFGLTKEEIILKSLKSLLDSCKLVKNKINLDIMDDSSGEEFLKKMESILKQDGIKYRIHRLNFKNNGLSLRYCYKFSEKVKEDLIYFCEDDYIHLKNIIPFILNIYESKIVGTDQFAVHPTDYPDRYIRMYPSYIFVSKNCHFRSVADTTGTFFITTKLYKKYKKYFYALAQVDRQSEEDSINKIWLEVPLLTPIPALAAHFNEGTLPPLIDWKKVVSEIKI